MFFPMIFYQGYTHTHLKRIKLSFVIKYSYFITGSIICPHLYASDIEQNKYQIYIAKSFIDEYSNPSISASKSSVSARWFDDYPSLTIGNKTEVGIINNLTDFSFLLRHQSIRGNHIGSASTYTCFGVFCSWVDYSLIGDLGFNDSIFYDIQFLQVWSARTFKLNSLELSPLAGLNLIDSNFIISGAGNRYNLAETLPLPFIGYNIKYAISKEIELIYDMHFSEIDLPNVYLKIIDSEFEFRYNISKFWKIGIGTSKLFVNLRWANEALNSELTIPQHSSFVKIIFFY